ncbi:MAG: alpha/beta hydrolase family protein, partial [Planctomycetia bacterium]|nr:alpha/beta hydrolase family protein [Planctomycetia bacterium]
MARFMCRWLKGEDKVITEGDWPIEKDATLFCTRSGQVLDDLKGKSVFDLNAALATELAKKRAEKPLKPEELRDAVQQLALPDTVPIFKSAEAGAIDKGQFTITKRVFSTGSGVPVPALVFEPKESVGRTPMVVYVYDQGAAAVADSAGKLASAGHNVMAVDLRGYGETAPGVIKDGKGPAFGVEFKESFLALHLNTSLLALRVADLLGVINTVPKEQGVELHGFGSAGPVALHAAMMNDRVKSLTLDASLVSWDAVVRTPISHNQLTNVVPGALKVYDLPDLAAAIAPRPLTIRNSADALGKPLTKEEAEQAYKSVREAYTKAKAADKFTLVVPAK